MLGNEDSDGGSFKSDNTHFSQYTQQSSQMEQQQQQHQPPPPPIRHHIAGNSIGNVSVTYDYGTHDNEIVYTDGGGVGGAGGAAGGGGVHRGMIGQNASISMNVMAGQSGGGVVPYAAPYVGGGGGGGGSGVSIGGMNAQQLYQINNVSGIVSGGSPDGGGGGGGGDDSSDVPTQTRKMSVKEKRKYTREKPAVLGLQSIKITDQNKMMTQAGGGQGVGGMVGAGAGGGGRVPRAGADEFYMDPQTPKLADDAVTGKVVKRKNLNTATSQYEQR